MTWLTEKEFRLFLEGILMGVMVLWLLESRIQYNRAKNNNKILENLKKYEQEERKKQSKASSSK